MSTISYTKPAHIKRAGFTLIQISILLTVASLAMVALLPSARTALTSNNASMTKMNAIFTSLRQFQAANGFLPCPADATMGTLNSGYGQQAANGNANCTGGSPAASFVDTANHVAIGMVPVRALGLSNDYAQDAFGRDISYGVDTNATSCWSSTLLTGQITVVDNGQYNNTVAALVSHGADGHGAWLPYAASGGAGTAGRLNAGSTDTDQLVNAHITTGTFPTPAASSLLAWSGGGSNTTFVKKPATATFDDLVVYKSPLWNINKLPLSQAATVPAITPPSNGTYLTGQTLTFTLTFNSTATVTGTPRLDLKALDPNESIGTSGTAYATYQSGTGTNTLTFSYTVQANDSAITGISVAAYVDVNGGSISPCPIQFTAPNLSGVKIGQAIYVADSTNARIEMLSVSGSYISQFGNTGGGGQLSLPYGIAIDPSSNVWVVDYNNNKILEYSSAGSFMNSYGSSGGGAGQFYGPTAIASDKNGNIWVADTGNNRVQELSNTGSWMQTIPASGCTTSPPACASSANNGRFYEPQGLAFDSSGNYLWVSDYGNNRIEEFTTAGTWGQTIPASCNGSSTPACATGGQVSTVQFMALDGSNNLWVADNVDGLVREINSSTAATMNSYGQSYNGAALGGPSGIAFDASGNPWISDIQNQHIAELNASSGSITKTFGSSGSGNGQLHGQYSLGIAIGNR